VARIVTLTTLAESKCAALSSRHTTPAPGSSTSTATTDSRPSRAASMPRLIRAASAAWDEEAHSSGTAAAAGRPGRATSIVRTNRQAVPIMDTLTAIPFRVFLHYRGPPGDARFDLALGAGPSLMSTGPSGPA
jgi:hypothetical protein